MARRVLGDRSSGGQASDALDECSAIDEAPIENAITNATMYVEAVLVREITLQAAADELDGIVAEASAGVDVVITRDGRREAVLVSWAAWERLSRDVSFGALLTGSPLEEGDIAPRHRGSDRDTGL